MCVRVRQLFWVHATLNSPASVEINGAQYVVNKPVILAIIEFLTENAARFAPNGQLVFDYGPDGYTPTVKGAKVFVKPKS